MQLNHSEACERNKAPLLDVLKDYFVSSGTVLEIGSGTGQHGVYFAANMPHLIWQTSDRDDYLPDIKQRGLLEGPANWRMPIQLDVTQAWPADQFDYIFSANTVHIMPWDAVPPMFSGIDKVLKSGGVFCLYGPFHYGGKATSESNARFHETLVSRGVGSGIRHFEELLKLSEQHGWLFKADIEMPANNRCLIWRKP